MAAIDESIESLEAKIRAVLPEEYQDCYDDVQPISMGSAGLKYGANGKVAWDEIWGSFCDLAMAGGPPHKGKLLEPGSQAEIDAQPERYRQVEEEICRGIKMVADLDVEPSPRPGWIRVDCASYGAAEWLTRAIVMENVSAHCDDTFVDLPAGPNYRVEKEIKNVITVIAKTCHYWFDHMWPGQHREIGILFAKMSEETPFIQPAFSEALEGERGELLRAKIAQDIQARTGLRPSGIRYANWVGVECPSVRAAIWMMRALVVSNVLARREETILYIPVNPASDPDGDAVVRLVGKIHGFAVAQGVI